MLSSTLLLVASMVVGQGEQKAPSVMPPEVLKELQTLSGEWNLEMTLDGKVQKTTWIGRWAPERHCQVGRVTGDGVQANTLTGYDKSTNTITELAFYANGDYYLFRYRVVSPGLWEGEGVGIDRGKAFTEKLELKRNGRDEFTWKATDFVLGGEKQADLIAVGRRVKKAKTDK